MNRIGILTFVRERNVGASLQAYALQHFFREITGNQIHIENIDYSFKSGELEWPKLINKAIRGLKTLKGRICNPNSFKAFTNFINDNIGLSEHKYTTKNIIGLRDYYDAVIAGSDQVWNGDIADKSINDFLLNFCGRCLKFSYAASFGFESTFNKYKDVILPQLKTYSAISLREPIGKDEIRDYTGLVPAINIDPTLLLSENDYSRFLDRAYIPHERYIFFYAVMRHNNMIDFVSELQRQTKLPVVFCTAYKSADFSKLKDAVQVKGIHPKQFLSLVHSADYVCTTSFHGTAFSIIFNKMFFVELKCSSGFNYRSENLIKNLGLAGRVIDGNKTDLDAGIDYRAVLEKLQSLRDEARQYLESIVDIVSERNAAQS
ncbi:MAG: polysaccharide pyruvyl transferase family protein [Synergistaceae bacterium]|jgi:hypothetical protein|nr:polysaccharide pyruvyl transferase family protein [Synergistaceae bacterium]